MIFMHNTDSIEGKAQNEGRGYNGNLFSSVYFLFRREFTLNLPYYNYVSTFLIFVFMLYATSFYNF